VRRDLERMVIGGRYFKFPFQPKNLLLNMPRTRLPGVLLELVGRSLRTCRNGGESVEDWVVELVGRRLYDYICLSGYIEKLYGLPASQVSREWGLQKLKFLARWREAGLLTLAARAWGEDRRVAAHPVAYPPTGIDRLAQALASSLTKAGGRVVLGAEVGRVDTAKPSVSFRQGGGTETIEVDFVISTLPVTALLGLMSPPAPPQVTQAGLKGLTYRSTALLFILLEAEAAIPHLCLYFTEEGPSFRRLTEFRRLSPRLAPEGKTSLCVEITFSEGDAVSRLDDHALFELASSQLTALGMLKRELVAGHRVLRLPCAYPVYELGYGRRLEAVLDHLAGLDTLVSIGRQGLFHYNTMANSIMEGHAIGERLAQAAAHHMGEIVRATYAGRLAKYEEAH
jgi:protoporphyrinogen oxidase